MKIALPSIDYPCQATLKIPGSKSMSNRALLLACLAEGRSDIFNLQVSDDIRCMVKGLQALGQQIELDELKQSVKVQGSGGRFQQQLPFIHCGESGTMARFLLIACAVIGGEYHFDAAESLKKRPFVSLFQWLQEQGVSIERKSEETFPLSLKSSGFRGGEIEVDASETGQILSALLMMAPFMQELPTFKVKQLSSRSYVDLTIQMMSDFGVQIYSPEPRFFTLNNKALYRSPGEARELIPGLHPGYHLEPDLSTASYFFAAATATAGEVSIELNRSQCKQGDLIFLSLLEKMGCQVQESSPLLTVKGNSQLRGITANLNATPDLLPTLAALAPLAQTPTLITGIAHTRHKESNRISTMRQGLAALDILTEEGPDHLKIYPRSLIKAATIQSHNDHRIAMAFSVLALRTPGLILEGAEAVNKSCPEFFNLWASLFKS